MPNTPAGMRQCPTRADGTSALFAHVIAPSTCQERQRGFYHKCPSCSFYNPRVRSEAAKGVNGHVLPPVPRIPPLEVPARNGAANLNGHAERPEPVQPIRPDVSAEAPVA
jgi:hypothetical protein